MSWIQSLILGIIQGLTEFLPVSSSGHLELGKAFMKVPDEGITFTVLVHGATVLSVLIIFRKDILQILKGLLAFKWNDELKYSLKIVISMIPAVAIGYFLESKIDQLFTGNLFLVGGMLIFTGALLSFTYFAKERTRSVSFSNAFIIGIAQAIAIIPGVSRSGATIATGLLAGNNKEEVAKFSFLMVVPVIVGANLKKILDEGLTTGEGSSFLILAIGFMAAFFTGLIACKWMLSIVKKGKLIWFGFYCFLVGTTAIIIHFIQ